MQIIKPYYKIIDKINSKEFMEKLEICGRTAYKSEGRITKGSADKFIISLIKRGHESVIEHVNLSIKFVCDRGVTHELVRHRLVSYTQESTRYCNYSGGIIFIEPMFWKKGSFNYIIWEKTMERLEGVYINLINKGATPQEARSVLPNSVKTEIVATTNLREWRHILKLRTAKSAHPQMREIMIPLLKELKEKLPIVFGDIGEDNV